MVPFLGLYEVGWVQGVFFRQVIDGGVLTGSGESKSDF